MSETIIPSDIVDEMRDSYMEYAMSVIVGRALPDVRDGLKPVHRRVLFSMSEQGNEFNKPFRKSARVVGDVIGKYHPHGDSAVYDTIVRMTQAFSMRYQLVDGQGNFGSVDGDSPAAMRYTEVRMKRIAQDLMIDLDKDTVNFQSNYDDSQEEPVVLPTRVPNLLLNGSTGIAVGMASNIPPHNLTELMNAFLYYIEHRHQADIAELMELIPGPDFPTGGTIVGKQGIYEAYTTGRGIIRVRAKTHTETSKDGRESLIITELPFMVNKAMLLEKIADLVRQKKIDGISDLRDESDRKGMRVFIQIKRGDNPDVVLSNLYKHTSMQNSFGINMLAIVDRQPKILNLPQVLELFLQHRIEVVTRRTRYELQQAENRMHILEGLMIALANLDDVLEIIRAAENGPAAESVLTERYGLSSRQGKAILDMRLQRLTGLEQEKIRDEHKTVGEAIADFQDILATPERVISIIREESEEIRERYGDERRTEIIEGDHSILIEELINEENMVVTITHAGYIKRSSVSDYRLQRRGGKGRLGMSTKDEDFVERMFVASTHDYLLFFTDRGQVFRKKVFELPQAGPTGRGKAVINLLPLREGEKVCTYLNVPQESENQFIMMCTEKGICKKIPMLDCAKIRVTGVRGISLDEGDSLISAQLTNGRHTLFFATRNGMGLRVHESVFRPMGRQARGVIGIRMKKGDRVVSAIALSGAGTLLTVTEGGYGKKTPTEDYTLSKNRGNQGMRTIRITEQNRPVVRVLEVEEDHQLFIITQFGKLIRIPVENIRIIGRVTQGNRLIKLNEGESVIAVATVIEEEEEDLDQTADDPEAPNTSEPDPQS
ncbi:MAG: DNA gyrase subunit A [SAR324 cluster bacterium]|jgi:DNA gyrase subunit A|nr:DNA gyrase subunit A [Deltaproteobacteria bacterium]MDP6093341.1 DNA gyrase subunit A [SAR324 cluster bacterium]MDP6245000.1 DNA gyrase subunit A [SAR324 cluster bacterium]MDP6329563.1 DNA gyrase subunit A [SAR324 cluster bacterium]MDP6463410.1 DNA gyrase subunit A [SAR324 cluster bacterium]|tara:strand:+ start:3149 stop:5641 length:2493 start_codon:yes stop_codon:yes gene_type:complete